MIKFGKAIRKRWKKELKKTSNIKERFSKEFERPKKTKEGELPLVEGIILDVAKGIAKKVDKFEIKSPKKKKTKNYFEVMEEQKRRLFR